MVGSEGGIESTELYSVYVRMILIDDCAGPIYAMKQTIPVLAIENL